MLRFLGEIAQRNKKREIRVAMSGRAKHGVEMALHVFPNAVTPRTDHHATAHIGRLRQFGGANHLLIPLRKIFFTARRNCAFCDGRVRHAKQLSAPNQIDQRPFHGNPPGSFPTER